MGRRYINTLLNGERYRKPSATATIRLYTPHAGQRTLHDCPARFRIANCGRRWGKTIGACNELVRAAWEKPNPQFPYWWISPTYKQARRPFRLIRAKFRGAIKDLSASEMRIELQSGGVIEFRSAEDYDNLRGEGLMGLVLDEAAQVHKAAWEEALRPMLSDTGGWALLPSTPKGRNWYFEMWTRGQDDEFPQYASFKFPSSSNPYIAPSEILEARSTLPQDVFRQEYEAEFLEDSAGVFRNVRGCVSGDYEPPQDGRRYVVGWDIAKHSDFSVLVVVDALTGHVVAFDRFNQIDYTVQIVRVEELSSRYRAMVLMDSTGAGDPVFEMARQARINVKGYQFTNDSKRKLIEHLALRMEQSAITFPPNPVLENELRLYQYEVGRSGTVRYSAPDGHHDDCVTSLALAAWAAYNMGSGSPIAFL